MSSRFLQIYNPIHKHKFLITIPVLECAIRDTSLHWHQPTNGYSHSCLINVVYLVTKLPPTHFSPVSKVTPPLSFATTSIVEWFPIQQKFHGFTPKQPKLRKLGQTTAEVIHEFWRAVNFAPSVNKKKVQPVLPQSQIRNMHAQFVLTVSRFIFMLNKPEIKIKSRYLSFGMANNSLNLSRSRTLLRFDWKSDSIVLK